MNRNDLPAVNGGLLSLSFEPEVADDPVRYRADKGTHTEQKKHLLVPLWDVLWHPLLSDIEL